MAALQASITCPHSRTYGLRKPYSPVLIRPQRLGATGGSRYAQFSQISRPIRLPTVSKRAAASPVCASTTAPMRVMIAGAPAAGKGTQCAKIVEKYGLAHICVGDILRDQIKKGTDAGKRAKGFMDNGNLVPNEIVVGMVKSALSEAKQGWLLDGYPRSQEQADAIEKENVRPDIFLLLEVPDEELVERVVGRRSDPETGEIYHLKFKPPPAEIVDRLTQRSDDTEEKVKNRLKTYHDNLSSIVNTYEDVIVKIDGNHSMDEVFESIVETLENNLVAS
ncbi:hypothetical protein BSKO_04110 [Bryopsis sp. KO-2023]|nr:hypothetical protein BSKO_04110 [Bryopsis sp. KO-2023]